MRLKQVFTKQFACIWIIGVLFCIPGILTAVIFPLQINALGGSTGLSGTESTLFFVAGMIFMPVAGSLSDKIGKRSVMAAGCILYALGCLIPVIEPTIFTVSLSRLIQLIGYSIANTAIIAAIPDVVPQGGIDEGMSFYMVGQGLASAVGPSIGLALIRNVTDFSVDCWFSAVLLLLCVPFMLPIKPKDKPVRREVLPVGREKGIWAVFEKSAVKPSIIQTICWWGVAGLTSYLTLFTTARNISGISAYYILSAAFMTVSRLFVGRLNEKFGSLPLLAPCMVTTAAVLVAIAFFANSFTLMLMGALVGLFQGVSMPILNSLAIKNAPENRRGAASSVYNIAGGIGMGFGASIWGIGIDVGGFSATFTGAGVLLIIGLALSFVLLRSPKPNDEASAAEKTA